MVFLLLEAFDHRYSHHKAGFGQDPEDDLGMNELILETLVNLIELVAKFLVKGFKGFKRAL